MTFTDIIIVIATACIVGLIIYRLIKRKNESTCSRCSYAKRLK